MTFKSLTYLVVAIIFLVVASLAVTVFRAEAADATTLPATVATTSPATVTATESRIFATSTCASRTISTTGASGIMLTFSDLSNFVPTATRGFWQDASTTVTYDAGQFGCGAVRVYSGVSQILTVLEAR